mmetsp:Transcript_2620/g.4834  ORF Transcript_2620/g.4834 Transcript_2620/m.4834 type:complete len:250 (-) Transcript_2620:348-1097(-)
MTHTPHDLHLPHNLQQSPPQPLLLVPRAFDPLFGLSPLVLQIPQRLPHDLGVSGARIGLFLLPHQSGMQGRRSDEGGGHEGVGVGVAGQGFVPDAVGDVWRFRGADGGNGSHDAEGRRRRGGGGSFRRGEGVVEQGRETAHGAGEGVAPQRGVERVGCHGRILGMEGEECFLEAGRFVVMGGRLVSLVSRLVGMEVRRRGKGGGRGGERRRGRGGEAAKGGCGSGGGSWRGAEESSSARGGRRGRRCPE